jgi:hypothetical protein
MKTEYVVACEIAKEVAWLKNFLADLGVMRIEQSPIRILRQQWSSCTIQATRNQRKETHRAQISSH